MLIIASATFTLPSGGEGCGGVGGEYTTRLMVDAMCYYYLRYNFIFL